MDDTDRSERHAKAVNESIHGGGCTETWEALTEIWRTETSTDRRGFLRRIGVTIGAIPLAGHATSADTGQADDLEIGVERRSGRARGTLLGRANRSEQRTFVVEQLGERPTPVDAFEYTIGSDSGLSVTYGDPGEDGPIVRYYESDAFPTSDVKAFGDLPFEGGSAIRTADGERGIVTDIHTSEAVDAAETLLGTTSEESSVAVDGSRRFVHEEAILSRSLVEDDRPFDVYVPIVDGDEIVDRAVVSGSVTRPNRRPSSSLPEGSIQDLESARVDTSSAIRSASSAPITVRSSVRPSPVSRLQLARRSARRRSLEFRSRPPVAPSVRVSSEERVTRLVSTRSGTNR